MFSINSSRNEAMDAGIKKAILVPLNLARNLSKLWSPAKEIAHVINFSTKSDLEVKTFLF